MTIMSTSIHWFRRDLRLSDNPALTKSAQSGQVIPVYILDTTDNDQFAMGAASRVWLHHSLHALNKSLGGKLVVLSGDPDALLPQFAKDHDARVVTWTRCYEPKDIERDTKLKSDLIKLGLDVISENGSLLWEPWQVKKKDGEPYKVFTPFFRKGCMNALPPRQLIGAPNLDIKTVDCSPIESLGLLPDANWSKDLTRGWDIGETAAITRMRAFLSDDLDGYKTDRNIPAKPGVSRLSPYLHFGEISPNQIWYASLEQDHGDDGSHFRSELGWREFSNHLLFHNPQMPVQGLNKKFDRFPWRDAKDALSRWQRGQTGIPIVDAGMRELWQTGYMHNRVRMIVASFLIKNLLIDWRHGAAWFWDTLFDADLANNSASWQWVAGCGADAAPFFRIFNPVLQGQKFDPDGTYTRQYVPELAGLSKKYLFCPWDAPSSELENAGVTLGKNYPTPIVELKPSRERALAALKSLTTQDENDIFNIIGLR